MLAIRSTLPLSNQLRGEALNASPRRVYFERLAIAANR